MENINVIRGVQASEVADFVEEEVRWMFNGCEEIGSSDITLCALGVCQRLWPTDRYHSDEFSGTFHVVRNLVQYFIREGHFRG